MTYTSVRGSHGVWGLTISPTIWALHFLACYVGGAVFCEKLASDEFAMSQLQRFITAATLVALTSAGVSPKVPSLRTTPTRRKIANGSWACRPCSSAA